MTVTERVRAGVLERIVCPCCGNRVVTLDEAHKRIVSEVASVPASLTVDVLGRFLRGAPVRSDVLDALDTFVTATLSKSDQMATEDAEKPDTDWKYHEPAGSPPDPRAAELLSATGDADLVPEEKPAIDPDDIPF